MTLSQVNGGGKMKNEDLRVKVAAPRVLLPYYFRPSMYSNSFFFFPEFHTKYDYTLSCTCYSN